MTHHALDYVSNAYLAVTLAASSPYFSNPSTLTSGTALSYVGPVGELSDVHLFGAPKPEWDASQLQEIAQKAGVIAVEVQEPRQRAKRDEF